MGTKSTANKAQQIVFIDKLADFEFFMSMGQDEILSEERFIFHIKQ
jgi:hypothetical protein